MSQLIGKAMTPEEGQPAADKMREILRDSDIIAPAMKEAFVYLATLLDWRGHEMERVKIRLNTLADEHETLANEHEAIMSGARPCRQVALQIQALERNFWRSLVGRILVPLIVGVGTGTVVALIVTYIKKGT